MRVASLLLFCAFFPAPAHAQFLDFAKHAYETLMTKPIRLSIEAVAPTAGPTFGIGLKPKDWRTPSLFMGLKARASVSTKRYWAADGSFAWQSVNQWRVEAYGGFRQMKQLNHFGIGNGSDRSQRGDFSMGEGRAGVYGYKRPVGLLAVGGRAETLFARVSPGESRDVPSVEEIFSASNLSGFAERTTYVRVGAFANFNYPYVRSERPRRGGDYMVAIATFRDVSGTKHTFNRIEIEGQERFPIAGPDSNLTVHGRVSSSFAGAGQSVPFYLMDTLGGADNLRGFKESIQGADETTATLRSFDSFRFRDRTTAFVQVEFRHRVYAQSFVSLWADGGAVSPGVSSLGNARLHRGIGLGVGVYRSNALAVRVDISLWGGEGHPYFLTSGRGLTFN